MTARKILNFKHIIISEPTTLKKWNLRPNKIKLIQLIPDVKINEMTALKNYLCYNEILLMKFHRFQGYVIHQIL